MILFPADLHAPQDDLPPVDVSYVHSRAEGRRRAQAQPIHPEHQVDEYGLPENPFAPSGQPQQVPMRRSRSAANAPVQPVRTTYAATDYAPLSRAMTAADGSQFDAPVSPEVPDWLKVARHNNYAANDRPQGPRVQAAPRQPQGAQRPARAPAQPSPYEQAGYPEHLLQEQRRLEQQQAAQPVYRRHGAQYAQRPQYQPAPPPQPTGMSYPPPRAQQPVQQAALDEQPSFIRRSRVQENGWQVETEEEPIARELPPWVAKVPWLGIAAFAAVMAVVVLWIMGMNYETRTQQVIDERAAQEAKIVENHPLKYESMIAEKAEKYNLSPGFIAAIMLNESSFRPDATNEGTGARGLMQLMNDTAEWIHGKLDLAEPYRFDSMYEPEMNAEFGCWYLNYLSREFGGDPVLVAAAFHAGQGEVRNWLNTAEYSPDGRTIAIEKIPFSDTRRYVARVLDAYAAYRRIYYGG